MNNIKILFVILFTLFLACSKETKAPDPVVIKDPTIIDEPVVDIYDIEITTEIPSSEKLDSLISMTYNFQIKDGTLSNAKTQNDVTLEDIERTDYISMGTSDYKLAAYHINIQKTQGEDLTVSSDLKLNFGSLPNGIDLFSCKDGNCETIDKASDVKFDLDPDDNSKASLSVEIKSKESDEEFSTLEVIEATVSFSNNGPIVNIKQGLKRKNIPLVLSAIIKKLKNVTEAEVVLSDLAVDSKNSNLLIDRIHQYKFDNCPQPLGILTLKLPSFFEKYAIDEIYVGPYQGSDQSKDGISMKKLEDGTYLFSFKCDAPVDVETEFPFSVIAKISEGQNAEVLHYPVKIKVDVQGAP